MEACLQQCDRIAPSEATQLLRALEGRLLDKVDAELDAQHDAQYLLLLVERVHARQESISLGGGGRGISSGGGSSRQRFLSLGRPMSFFLTWWAERRESLDQNS